MITIDEIEVGDEVISTVIRGYTREAGVRTLEVRSEDAGVVVVGRGLRRLRGRGLVERRRAAQREEGGR